MKLKNNIKTTLPLLTAFAGVAFVSTANAAVQLYDGASGHFSSDTWSTAANWNDGVGPAPSGTDDVDIGASEHVSVLLTATSWAGTLNLQTGAELEMGSGSNLAMHNSIFSGVTTLTMNTGSKIRLRTGANTSDAYNLNMAGMGEYMIGSSTSAHHKNRTLSGNIIGSGNLGIRTTNGQAWTLTGDNSAFTGRMYIGDNDGAGFGENLSGNNRYGLVADSSEALTNLLQVGDGGNLRLNFANTIDDLNIFGASSDEVGHFKLFLNGVDLTVNSATINGSALAAGTYNTASGILDSDGDTNFFGGSGNLIVVPEPSSTALLGLGGLALILRRRK